MCKWIIAAVLALSPMASHAECVNPSWDALWCFRNALARAAAAQPIIEQQQRDAQHGYIWGLTSDADAEAAKRKARYEACRAENGIWNAEVGACNETTFR